MYILVSRIEDGRDGEKTASKTCAASSLINIEASTCWTRSRSWIVNWNSEPWHPSTHHESSIFFSQIRVDIIVTNWSDSRHCVRASPTKLLPYCLLPTNPLWNMPWDLSPFWFEVLGCSFKWINQFTHLIFFSQIRVNIIVMNWSSSHHCVHTLTEKIAAMLPSADKPFVKYALIF